MMAQYSPAPDPTVQPQARAQMLHQQALQAFYAKQVQARLNNGLNGTGAPQGDSGSGSYIQQLLMKLPPYQALMNAL